MDAVAAEPTALPTAELDDVVSRAADFPIPDWIDYGASSSTPNGAKRRDAPARDDEAARCAAQTAVEDLRRVRVQETPRLARLQPLSAGIIPSHMPIYANPLVVVSSAIGAGGTGSISVPRGAAQR